MLAPVKPRRALSQIAGPVRAQGDARLARLLAGAWEAATREEGDVLTHGFHPWPARMHWAVARTLLAELDAGSVLDPFCGGGTVLVEARVAGRASAGVDLNPLAMRVADVRTQRRTARSRDAFLRRAEAVALASETRVRERAPIRVALPPEETRWYAPHVLKELGGLREEIRAVDDAADRRALAVVLSSIVVKFSKQRADTAEEETEKRIRKGLCTEFFLRKSEELVARWADLFAVARGPAPRLEEGDARELPSLLGKDRFGLVLTSPPYGGTYDYARHHARRLAWLELDDRRLRALELGARRDATVAGWERDVRAMLHAMREVTRKDALLVLVIGDAEVGGRRIAAPPQLERLGSELGLRCLASASQPRPEWRGSRARAPREEHLVVLGAGVRGPRA